MEKKPDSFFSFKKGQAMRTSYWAFGTHLIVLASHADTAGRYDLVENFLPPGA